jgi:arylsulfatase A-like enzyme
LLPICTGERAEYQRELFWRTQTRAAARLGAWKYVNEAGTEHLYDLTVDLGEKTDLRTKRPDIFERVRSRYQEWAAQMLPRPTPV